MPQLDVKRVASELLQKGRLSEAIGAYKSLLEQSKRPNPAIVNLIGDIYIKQGDHESGFDHFLQACKQYSDEGLYHNGIAVAKKILRLDKDQTEVYGTLGDLYAKQGLGMDAVKFLTEYARRKEAVNEFPAALAALAQACETLGDCPEAFVAYAENLERVDRQQDAADHYRKASEVYAMRGATEAAGRWSTRAKSLSGDEEVDDTSREVVSDDESSVWDMMSLRDLTSNPSAEEAETDSEPAETGNSPEAVAPPAEAPKAGRPGSGVRPRSQWGVFDPGKNPAMAPPPPLPTEGAAERPEPVKVVAPPDPPPVPPPPLAPPAAPSEPPITLDLPSRLTATPPPSAPPAPPSVAIPSDPLSLELDSPFGAPEPAAPAPSDELTLEPPAGGGLELDLPAVPPPPVEEIRHVESVIQDAIAESSPEAAPAEEGPVATDPAAGSSDGLSGLPGIIMPPSPADEAAAPASPPPPPLEPEPSEPPSPASTALPGMPPVAEVTGFSGFFPRPEIPEPEPEPEPEPPVLPPQEREPAIVIGDDTELVREGGDVNEVIKDFREATSQILDADDYRAHYDLGTTYLEMELFDEAAAEFALASNGDEFALLSREMMGYCYLRQGLIDHAIVELKKGLSIPDREERERLGLLYNLGIACSVLDQTNEAIGAFQKILELEPGFRDTRNRLDRLVTQGR